MGGNIGRDAVKGIQSIAKKGVSKIPIVGSIVDPIMNLLKRSDEQKLRERKFTRRRVIVNHIDEIWASDLVEMQQFSRWNKGYKYLLMVIDVFSKYGWIIPLKDKKG